MKKLMSGNDAVAHGAWEAGVKFAAGYPGTPSTEVLENLGKYVGIYEQDNSQKNININFGAEDKKL